MFILENRYGDKGYFFWFKTLELLGSTNGHAYYFDKEENCEYITAYTRTTKEQAIEILDLLANLDTIDKDLWRNNHIIWSDNFIDGVRDAYRNRVVDMPDKPISDVRNHATIGVSDVKNPQTKLNKTKLKESKGNKTILPDFIDKEIWDAFLEMRGKKRTVPTEHAKILLIQKLGEFRDAGDDPNEVLKRSIMNGWTGIFPLDRKGQHEKAGQPRDFTKKPSQDKYTKQRYGHLVQR